MKTRFLVLLVSLGASNLALAQSTEEEAGDVSEVDKDALGPLRERVPPTTGRLFQKKGRFEISPSASVSIRDAFFTKYVFGGSLTYHPSDSFGVSLHGGYVANAISGAAQICTPIDGSEAKNCKPPSYSQLNGKAPGQLTLLGGLEVQWAPIYGKVAVFSERFLHFDLYLLGGPTYVQYLGPASNGVGSQSMSTVGGNAGLGVRFVASQFFALRLEARDLVYVEQVPGLVTAAGAQPTSLRNQFFFELGLSFFLPSFAGEG